MTTTVNVGDVTQSATTTDLGTNLTIWDNPPLTSTNEQLASADGLTQYRFPGGSGSDDIHFNMAENIGYAPSVTIPQFAQFISTQGGIGTVTLDYGSGSPQEAAAELAYLQGSPTDTTVIGTGLEWNDSTSQWVSVNWGTVGYWASLRAATPLATDDGLNFMRIDHAAPFTDIKYWEVGNEEYGSWEIDHHGTAGPGGVSTAPSTTRRLTRPSPRSLPAWLPRSQPRPGCRQFQSASIARIRLASTTTTGRKMSCWTD